MGFSEHPLLTGDDGCFDFEFFDERSMSSVCVVKDKEFHEISIEFLFFHLEIVLLDVPYCAAKMAFV